MRAVTIGVSLKAYFSLEAATAWFADVANSAGAHPAIVDGRVSLFVVPTAVHIPTAAAAFAGTAVQVGAQDVSQFEFGPYTGEVTARHLAELGVGFAEVGHAERRRLFGETDQVTAAKAAAAARHGITPLVCVGESVRAHPASAAAVTVSQTRASLDGAASGPVVIAYEPVWAIGMAEPAPDEHIATVTAALRSALDADGERSDARVIYGGSAGPGLLTRLSAKDPCGIDGLFLGRFAHDSAALAAVLDEAGSLAARRAAC